MKRLLGLLALLAAASLPALCADVYVIVPNPPNIGFLARLPRSAAPITEIFVHVDNPDASEVTLTITTRYGTAIRTLTVDENGWAYIFWSGRVLDATAQER